MAERQQVSPPVLIQDVLIGSRWVDLQHSACRDFSWAAGPACGCNTLEPRQHRGEDVDAISISRPPVTHTGKNAFGKFSFFICYYYSYITYLCHILSSFFMLLFFQTQDVLATGECLATIYLSSLMWPDRKTLAIFISPFRYVFIFTSLYCLYRK